MKNIKSVKWTFVVLFLGCMNNIFSQSMEDTEKWILTKLNLYTTERKETFTTGEGISMYFYTSNIQNNYKFGFQTIENVRFFIIVYNKENYHYEDEHGAGGYPTGNKKFTHRTSEEWNIFIPIYSIKSIIDKGYENDVVYKNVKVATHLMEIQNSKGSYKKIKNGILEPTFASKLSIITDIEENIIQRLNKAFEHLKTFHKEPKININEPF